MPYAIQNLGIVPTKYYAGGAKGWIPLGLGVISYSTIGAAQAVIDSHRMYAIPVSLPVVSQVVNNFFDSVIAVQSLKLSDVNASGEGDDVVGSFPGTTGPYMAMQFTRNDTGALPTLDGKIQHSDDGMAWTDIPGAAFVQVGDLGNYQQIVFNTAKAHIRYAYVLAGTTPVYVCGCVIFRSTV